jgi:plasmid maintenance system killer protein
MFLQQTSLIEAFTSSFPRSMDRHLWMISAAKAPPTVAIVRWNSVDRTVADLCVRLFAAKSLDENRLRSRIGS